MSFATGVGSMPGEDQPAYEEALRVVLGELGEEPGLPFLPEVPGRGITAGMVGRSLGLVADLGIDLQPAGWRIAGPQGSSGADHRRARSLLAQDLDFLEEQAQDRTGDFKIQVAGPWTLAATVEKPRGDKVLSDHGARRDLAQALAEGVREHVRDVRRRLSRVDRLVVQVDEPAISAVLGGGVPTASGFGRHRTVHPPEASEHLGWVMTTIAEEGGEPWVHCCAADAPLALLRGAGVRGLSVDLGITGAAGFDVLAEALEAGETVVLGLVPTDASAADTDLVERVLRWLDALGLDPETAGPRVGLSPTCGLAGVSAGTARAVLALGRAAALNLP